MTDCLRTDIRDILPDWVHGSLDEAAATDVAEHLTTCAVCAAEAELLRSLRGVAMREPRIDVQRVAAAVVEQTIPSRTPGHRPTRWRAVLGGLAVAASVAFGALLIRSADDETVPQEPIAQNSSNVVPEATGHPRTPDDSTTGAEQRFGDTAKARQRDRELPESALRLAVAEVPVSCGLSDLGVDELEALLRRLDDIEALPQTSPAPALTTDLEVR